MKFKFTMHWGRFVLVMVVLALMAGCRQPASTVQAAPETTNNLLSPEDGLFLKDAEDHAVKARDLGGVALEKSDDPDIREYAKMLVDDHTTALHALVNLIRLKGLTESRGMSETDMEAMRRLKSVSGPDFNREFVDIMLKNDEKEAAAYQGEVQAAQDLDLRAYVAQTLPLMEKHLTAVRNLQRTLSGY